MARWQHWADIALGIVLGSLLASLAFWLALPPRGEPIVLEPPPPTPTPAPLRVYVVGAVRRPGVFALPRGSRVEDAVAAAGGFTAAALRDAVNLAAPLQDGLRVYVPSRLTPTPHVLTPTAAPLSTAVAPEERIDLNTASAEALERLPRIGPALAQRIIAYREAHGPFQKVDDLLAVKGIGPTLLETIRPYVTVHTGP